MQISQNNGVAELDRRIEDLVKSRRLQNQKIEQLIRKKYEQDEELQRLAELKRQVSSIRAADAKEYVKAVLESPAVTNLSAEVGNEKIRSAIMSTDTFQEVYQILYVSSVKLSELFLDNPIAYHFANLQVQIDLNLPEAL